MRPSSYDGMSRPDTPMAPSATLSTVLILVGLRILAPIAPSMWLWGLNVERFLPAGYRISAWLCAVGIAGMVAIVRRGSAGPYDSRRRVGWLAPALIVGIFGLTLWALEDRTWVTGDFLIRGSRVASLGLGGNFTQSLGLEILLFDRVPHWLSASFPRADAVPRAIGVVAGVLIALTSFGLARQLWSGSRDQPTAIGICLAGGFAVVLTGLGKPAGLMCALVALTAWAGTSAARGSRVGAIGLGVTVAFGLLLHRSGLLLVPAWLIAMHHHGRATSVAAGDAGRRQARVIGIVLPALVLLLLSPRLYAILTSFDLPYHVLGSSMTGLSSPFTPQLLGLRLSDLANLVFLMVPSALLAGVHVMKARLLPATSTGMVLTMLSGTWIVAALVVRPQQGIFRDLDVFAPGAVALAIVSAHILVIRWRTSRLAVWESSLVLGISVVGALQILLTFHNPEFGLRRTKAYATELPIREQVERALVWDFLALRSFALQDWPAADEACDHAVALAPSPRLLLMSGLANTNVGAYEEAAAAYHAVLRKSPQNPIAWAGLAGVAVRLEDWALADSATAIVRSFSPKGPEMRAIREVHRLNPAFFPPRTTSGQ